MLPMAQVVQVYNPPTTEQAAFSSAAFSSAAVSSSQEASGSDASSSADMSEMSDMSTPVEVTSTDACTTTANHAERSTSVVSPKNQAKDPRLSPDLPENASMTVTDFEVLTIAIGGKNVEVKVPLSQIKGERLTYECKPEIDPNGYFAAFNDGTKIWKSGLAQPKTLRTFQAVFVDNDAETSEIGNLYFTSPVIEGEQKHFVVPGEVMTRCYASVMDKYKSTNKYHIMVEEANTPFFKWQTHVIDIEASIKRFGWSYVNPPTSAAKNSDDDFDEDEPAPPPPKVAKKQSSGESSKTPKAPKASEAAQPSTVDDKEPEVATAANPKNAKEAPSDEATADSMIESAAESQPEPAKKGAPRKRGPSKKKQAEEAAAAAAKNSTDNPTTNPTTNSTDNPNTNSTAPIESLVQESSTAMDVDAAQSVSAQPESRVTGRKRSLSQGESSSSNSTSKRQVSEIKKSDLCFFGGDAGLLSKLQEAYNVGWDKSFQSITFNFSEGADEPVLVVTREAP